MATESAATVAPLGNPVDFQSHAPEVQGAAGGLQFVNGEILVQVGYQDPWYLSTGKRSGKIDPQTEGHEQKKANRCAGDAQQILFPR